ncbi:substrate-binding domain-containing protein [Dyadobacter bucti]|uniref:substrate-binding domain-containing protein n=1 Tax=Dyadobacter bucti TaxID=2572203 RepID=UPI0011098863|nr:substrate-binding domain-containing protein [Dyadobacter bucti]
MKKKIVRIKDIAEKAQTSKGTVDRVLHNRGRVADDVRERILKIIEELNYEPNFIAQSLKSQRTFNLVALIPDPHVDPYWEAPKAGLEKAEKELRQYGIYISQLIFNPHEVTSFIAKAEEATKENPDGVLIAPIFYKEVLPFFKEWATKDIPYVLFNTQIEHVDPLCYIGQDSFQSGELAAKIICFGLQSPGSILVAHINEDISNSAHLITKEEGFRNYFARKAEREKFRIVTKEINFSEGTSLDMQLDQILTDEPQLSAVYVTNSKAFEIASYLERKGLNDIKLVGYDLLKPNLDYLDKEIISFLINQNPLGQGYWGIHQLANHLVFKKEIQPIKFLPLDIITKENLDYYLDPE